ncbi:MAG: hypothetical protein HQ558_00510, partial [Candidatus Omnitrophica bacterium]|nr:hypothetical protein [Candidatus Omnitrophota bacterium]
IGRKPFSIEFGNPEMTKEKASELGYIVPELPGELVYDETTGEAALKASGVGSLDTTFRNISALTPESLQAELTASEGRYPERHRVLTTSSAAASLVGETLAKEAAQIPAPGSLLARAAKPAPVQMKGTIAINEASISPVLLSTIKIIYDKDSDSLKALEERLGFRIRLLSQLEQSDMLSTFVVISHEQLEGYPSARYLLVNPNTLRTAFARKRYTPLIPEICIARVLGSGEKAEEITYLLNRDGFYESVFGHAASVNSVQEFLDTGIFNLPVPTFDHYGTEQEQRLSMAAAIAA